VPSGVIFVNVAPASGSVQRAFDKVIGSAMRTDSSAFLEYCRIRREVEAHRFQSLAIDQLHRFRDLRARFATRTFDELYQCWSRDGDQAVERFNSRSRECILHLHRLDFRHYRTHLEAPVGTAELA